MIGLVIFLGIFGTFEFFSNIVHIGRLASGKGLGSAKKIHGDFPPSASDSAWKRKVVTMLLLGLLALVTAFSLFNHYAVSTILLYIFAGLLSISCLSQAIAYGKNHKPSIGSFIISMVFIGVVYFVS